MRTRQEIKADAKAAMKQQWGTSIGTLILYAVVIAVAVLVCVLFIFVNVAVYIVLLLVVMLLLAGPLIVGVSGVFAKIYRREPASAGGIFSAFSNNYPRKLGGMLWMELFVFLWSLLFVIPGIVKAFAYSMIPYILADCPNVTAKEAMKLSMRMTKGYKGTLFVMGLSFIGWYMLSSLTFGILALVYVNPYMYTTIGGYYNELKKNAIESGTISAAEFGEEVSVVVEEEFAN